MVEIVEARSRHSELVSESLHSGNLSLCELETR